VDFSVLDDVDFLKEVMLDAAVKSQAQVLSVTHKKFEPNGCTILILVSESHLSIHTYPEEAFAAVDCYTCGEKVDPQVAIDYVIEKLQPKKKHIKKLIRGIKEQDIQVID
jgi:S-adenosylmethionine decarboxylase